MKKKISRIATIIALCLLTQSALNSCTDDVPSIGSGLDGDPDGTATTGALIVGNLGVDGGSTSTRFSENTDAAVSPWREGDCIVVSATELSDHGGSGQPISGTYIYSMFIGTWQWKDDDSKNPDGTTDNRQLFVERIDPATLKIESWHGYTFWPGSTDYLNQSDTPTGTAENPTDYIPGERYRLQDYLLSTSTTLSGRTLSGTLQHQRVDLVLRVTDGDAANASPSYGNRLPADAVLRLAGGTPANSDKQNIITAWREKSEPGADGKTVTTYRALVALEDVPGIKTSTDDDGNMTGTVANNSLLGTMTYTPDGSNTEKTLRITYSMKDGAVISRGKRITIEATFADISQLEATATLGDWTDTGAGDAGTSLIQPIKEVTEDGITIYEIYTAKGLKMFADMVNGEGEYTDKQNRAANARLMMDIDLSSVCGEANSWTPIGNYVTYDTGNKYTGHFDGQGHTVSGLYISGNSYPYAGLFGRIGQDTQASLPKSSISRLHVIATKIENNTNGITTSTGVLIGWNDGIITACSTAGDIECSNNYTAGNTSNYAGGVAGYNNGTIIACRATGNVKGSASGNNYPYNFVGGVVGSNNSGTIIACYATGDIEGYAYYNLGQNEDKDNNRSGGVVGSNQVYGKVIASYSTASNITSQTYSGYSYKGGVVGCNEGYSSSSDKGYVQYCATTFEKVSNGAGSTTANCTAGLTSFSAIRAIVASSDAQGVWLGSIDPATLVISSLADNGGLTLDGSAGGSIWRPAIDVGSGLPGSAGNTGSLKLWWEEE